MTPRPVPRIVIKEVEMRRTVGMVFVRSFLVLVGGVVVGLLLFGGRAALAGASVTPGWECVPTTAGQPVVSGGTGAAPSCPGATTAVLAPTYVSSGVGGKPTVVLSSVNLQIVSGSGSTSGAVNGEGNLVIGYAENTGARPQTGSHNLIVGSENGWTSFGGIIGGLSNQLTARYSTVVGANNLASGGWSFAAGQHNKASGNYSSVTGGRYNVADGLYSGVVGGCENVAGSVSALVGTCSDAESVLGGFENIASGPESTVGGGQVNTASGGQAAVSGGKSNTAPATASSVLGGSGNTTTANCQAIPASMGTC